MTTCRFPTLVLAATLLGAAAAAAQNAAPPLLPPPPAAARPRTAVPAPPPPAAAGAEAAAGATASAPLPDVPRPILTEWIARVQRDSSVWAQCLRGSVSERQDIAVTAVVEAVGQRLESGSLRYGCPAGSIGSVHSFTPGSTERCAASDDERDAFFAGWEQVRVLVCPGPRLLWLVRPARPKAAARVEAAVGQPVLGPRSG